MQSTYAIIVAGGRGKRMGQPKQFLKVGGKPILEWTLLAFERAKAIDVIILVVNREDIGKAKSLKSSKLIKVVAGGKERQDSVRNGLRALPKNARIVAIHDGARPFVSKEIIIKAVKIAKRVGAVVVGVPVLDTVKQMSNDKCQMTLDRSCLWLAQTPQVFRAELIKKAYARLRGKVTDDAMAVERLGVPVKMVMGSYRNIKITTPFDLKLAETMVGEGA